jgi:hypothetical protein
MFVIGEAVIEEEIAHERFACDLVKCKGACCTLPGGRGAPLEDAEVQELEGALPFARKYLSEQHLQHIKQAGIVEGTPGNYATVCIDDRDCVFVYYEEDIARCSLEKTYIDGETTWRKPLSCHLFPIRVTRNGSEAVRYEQISECSPAIDNGRRQNMPMYEFLKDPLVRKFGQEWYDEFHSTCEQRNDTDNDQ